MNLFAKLPYLFWNKKLGVMHCVWLTDNNFEMQAEVQRICAYMCGK